MSDRQPLLDLIRTRALKFGEFTLASGQTSSYYLDGKQVTLHADGLRRISEGILDLLDAEGAAFDAVGGMSIGADPIVGGVLTAAAARGRTDLVGFLVRKEAKGHGTQRFIEGPLEPGMRAVILEDVVTTGGSSVKAVERVREFGVEPVRVVCIVDRLQGGAAAFEAIGLPLSALATVRDFGIQA